MKRNIISMRNLRNWNRILPNSWVFDIGGVLYYEIQADMTGVDEKPESCSANLYLVVKREVYNDCGVLENLTWNRERIGIGTMSVARCMCLAEKDLKGRLIR